MFPPFEREGEALQTTDWKESSRDPVRRMVFDFVA